MFLGCQGHKYQRGCLLEKMDSCLELRRTSRCATRQFTNPETVSAIRRNWGSWELPIWLGQSTMPMKNRFLCWEKQLWVFCLKFAQSLEISHLQLVLRNLSLQNQGSILWLEVMNSLGECLYRRCGLSSRTAKCSLPPLRCLDPSSRVDNRSLLAWPGRN